MSEESIDIGIIIENETYLGGAEFEVKGASAGGFHNLPLILRESAAFDYPTRVECITKKHFKTVVALIEKYYIPNNHLWNLIGITERGYREFICQIYQWLAEGTSLIIIHSETENILGFIIGSFWGLSDWTRELKRDVKYKSEEMRAIFEFYHNFHHDSDLFLVENTNVIYNIHIWMIAPNLKKYYYVIFEIFVSLVYFCNLVKAGAISAVVTKHKDKKVAEYIGFNLVSSVCYLDCFEKFNIGKRIIGLDYTGYFLSFPLNAEGRIDTFGSTYDVISLPEITEDRRKINDKKYWQELYWSAFEKKNYFTPGFLKGIDVNNILV